MGERDRGTSEMVLSVTICERAAEGAHLSSSYINIVRIYSEGRRMEKNRRSRATNKSYEGQHDDDDDPCDEPAMETNKLSKPRKPGRPRI